MNVKFCVGNLLEDVRTHLLQFVRHAGELRSADYILVDTYINVHITKYFIAMNTQGCSLRRFVLCYKN